MSEVNEETSEIRPGVVPEGAIFTSVDEYLRKVASFGGEDELLVSQGFKIDALAMRQGVVLVEDDNELVGQDLARREL